MSFLDYFNGWMDSPTIAPLVLVVNPYFCQSHLCKVFLSPLSDWVFSFSLPILLGLLFIHNPSDIELRIGAMWGQVVSGLLALREKDFRPRS